MNNEHVYIYIARSTFSLPVTLNNSFHRKFRAIFGVPPYICVSIWTQLQDGLNQGSEKKHLLWCLHHMKVYSTENVNCAIWGCDEKTFRKWSWYFIGKISLINIVSFFSIIILFFYFSCISSYQHILFLDFLGKSEEFGPIFIWIKKGVCKCRWN